MSAIKLSPPDDSYTTLVHSSKFYTEIQKYLKIPGQKNKLTMHVFNLNLNYKGSLVRVISSKLFTQLLHQRCSSMRRWVEVSQDVQVYFCMLLYVYASSLSARIQSGATPCNRSEVLALIVQKMNEFFRMNDKYARSLMATFKMEDTAPLTALACLQDKSVLLFALNNDLVSSVRSLRLFVKGWPEGEKVVKKFQKQYPDRLGCRFFEGNPEASGVRQKGSATIYRPELATHTQG